MGNARWTVEQVLALAPDAGSRTAARALVSPRRWSDLGSNESLVWGKCQGSGREPYQVTVDLNEPAFRCTCPSRKFPCKHGVALLLQWAANDGSVADADGAAAFAADWATERAERAQQKEGRRRGKAGAPPDPEALAKRRAERESLMTAGLEDFERWLFDLVRQGLAAARRQPFAYWDTAAGRLVDAQVPGLAERVRFMAGEVHRRTDWAEFLLAEAGRWYLAIRAWSRRDGLPDDVMGDLRTVLGWSRRAEEAMAGDRVTDRWHVIGLHQDGDERLQSQRTWLWGETSGQLVVILDFAAAGARLAVAGVLGSIVEGELALYPGSPPRRALFTGEHSVVGTATGIDAASSVADALDATAGYLAANPWSSRTPMLLSGVVPVAGEGGGPVVVDGHGDSLPFADDNLWRLLAVSGGHSVDLFGEWADDRLLVCSVAADDGLVMV